MKHLLNGFACVYELCGNAADSVQIDSEVKN
jgi:hypothetical protein